MTKPRVLIATADRTAWSQHRSALAADLEVVFAESARETLEKLSQQGPFAALVAELRVPGMSGVDLLGSVRQHFPDTGRLLVADGDDREAAFAAINEAHVHSFFLTPFAPEVFADAIWERVTEFQRAVHERAVLLQQAEGIVQLLTGLVHPQIAIPPISEAGEHMRARARAMAQALKLPSVAELETAALLSRVALASVPRHILDKLLTHERLNATDSDALARIPDVGLALVQHLPRFAGVAEVFRHQGVDPGPATVREDGVREHRVPLASRILRAVVDLQLHENAGLSVAAALAEMRRLATRYDADVLKTLEVLFAGPAATNATFTECMVADLVVGSVLAADALSHEGVPLVSAGTEISAAVLHRLENFAELGEVVEPLYVIPAQPGAEETEPAETEESTSE